MLELLHSFAIGIAFSVGVFSGAVLCQMCNRKAREEFVADMKAEREAVEARLLEQCEGVLRIASAMENLTELKLRDSVN